MLALGIVLIPKTLSSVLTGLYPTMPVPLKDSKPIDLPIEEGWSVVYQREEPFNAMGFRKNLGGGSSRLDGEESNADHKIAYILSSVDAQRAYEDHNHTRDTKGKFARTWTPVPHFFHNTSRRRLCRIITNNDDKLPKDTPIVFISILTEENAETLSSLYGKWTGFIEP